MAFDSSAEAPLSLISAQMMAAQQRPSSRRGPSGAWGRLRSGTSDPLEQYGLPSKGESRLNDRKAQETFYNKIVERYMKFCAASGGGDELDKQFAALSVSSDAFSGSTGKSTTASSAGKSNSSNTNTATHSTVGSPSPELSTILMAMRKLREAIVATHRHDTFAQRAYVFIIHAAILTKHQESYHPALLYLLRYIHPRTPLSEPEQHEFVGYHILDLACRQGDLAAAYATRARLGYRDHRVDAVLKALAHDNWVLFWRVRRAVDGYQKRVVEWADEGVRLQALKSLGRSYITVDKPFVERCTETTWADLVRSGVGWELVEGDKIIVRRLKPK